MYFMVIVSDALVNESYYIYFFVKAWFFSVYFTVFIIIEKEMEMKWN